MAAGGAGPPPGPLVARVDPESSGPGAPAPRIEHRHGRVVGEEMVGGKGVAAQPLVQRIEPPAGAADPAGERRAVDLGAVAGKDLCLAIERGVVAIFGDQHQH